MIIAKSPFHRETLAERKARIRSTSVTRALGRRPLNIPAIIVAAFTLGMSGLGLYIAYLLHLSLAAKGW